MVLQSGKYNSHSKIPLQTNRLVFKLYSIKSINQSLACSYLPYVHNEPHRIQLSNLLSQSYMPENKV